MNTTQEHLLIADIVDDIVLLKDGGGALVLHVSAVNFGLLSEREQYAIIASFAQMLNSLSFSIQIVIHSKRLNITRYLSLLDKTKRTQTNPLLIQMITSYRQFIQTLIKENEVLDKKFYIVIPLFKLELGITSSKDTLKQKIKTVLLPRRDQVIKQLSRVGLKATQLTNEKLIELFFDIYNEVSFDNIQTQQALLNEPKVAKKEQREVPKTLPQHEPIPQPGPFSAQIPTRQPSKTHPFVVEELEESA